LEVRLVMERERSLLESKEKTPSPSLPELSIKTLPYRLFLVSIEKEMLEYCVKILLKLSFFSDVKSTFFCFTDTEEEVSLILDENSLNYFKNATGPKFNLVIGPDCWRAIQVDEDASMIDVSGIVANLSGPLTEAGIGMLYLSAYECDLILVQENQVEAAVSCLYNKICIKGESKRQEITKKTLPSSPIVATAIPSRLALATINSLDDLPYCEHSILQQFFFPSRTENRFFSFFFSIN